jgi:asparagine synthase (glutamine-hydrolysing)
MGKVLDQPFADSSIIPTFMLSEFARQDVVVALGGDGGDEAFGGYVRYKAALFLNRINFLLAVNPSPILQRYINANPRIEKLLKHSKYQSLASRYMSFQSLIQKSELRRILDRDIIDLAQKDEFSILWDSIGKKKNVRKLQMMDLESYLPGDLLYKADMATMANSLELRSPFLDYRVVELGLSLPASYKIKNGRTKLILKDILAQYLPRETFERPKMGFGIPQAKWIRKELRKNIEETFFSKEFINRGWFNSEEVCRIYEMHKNGKDYSRIIWPIFMLELWARNWLDA